MTDRSLWLKLAKMALITGKNMLTIDYATQIINLVVFFIAYANAVTLAGTFRAWISLKMGDDTAKELGFLNLNPANHIDFLGLVCFYFLGIGWGKQSPINVHNIYGRFKKLRQFCAFFSNTLAHFLLSFITLILLILIFGKAIVPFIRPLLMNQSALHHLNLTMISPGSNSFMVLIGFIVLVQMYLHVLLGVLTAIVNSVYMAFDISAISAENRNYYIVLLLPILLILFLANPIHQVVLTIITKVGFALSSLIYR